MISLKKAMLPQAVNVCGSFYKIHTDFKYILRFRDLLKEKPEDANEYDFMYLESPPPDKVAGQRAIYDFMNPPRELPRRTGEETSDIVLDYDIDAEYIYAAFMEQYHIDLIDTPLHWYKFLALLHGLHDTELNRIISCRLWRNESGKNGEYERFMQKQYEAWRLTQPDEQGPDEALDDFLSQLKG